MAVDYDPIAGLHIALCRRCTDTLTTDRLDQAHTWADTHDCDPELAALLAEVIHGAAA